jgi:hypothetical protein
VHEDEPVTFETRWALSYLPGPLTRAQIGQLMASRKQADAVELAGSLPGEAAVTNSAVSERPVLPPDVKQCFLPVRVFPSPGAQLLYEPGLFATARLSFTQSRYQVDTVRDLAWVASIRNEAVPVNWETARLVALDAGEVESDPYDEAGYGDIPASASRARSYVDWEKALIQWLYAHQRLTLYRSPALKEVSRPQEEERDFRIRLEVAAREERDRLAEALRGKYASKIASLQEKIRRAESALEREQEQSKHQKLQSMISIGATLLGAFLGRSVISQASVGRAGSAARSISRAGKEAGDVARARENIEACRQQLADLEAEFGQEAAGIEASLDPAAEDFETIEIRPKKTDITVRFLTLAWLPCWQDSKGNRVAAWTS